LVAYWTRNNTADIQGFHPYGESGIFKTISGSRKTNVEGVLLCGHAQESYFIDRLGPAPERFAWLALRRRANSGLIENH